jgi:tetratricopeptide (TPR) repeat protein
LQSKYIKVITGDTLYSILDGLNLLERKSYSSEDLRKVVNKGGAKHVLYGNFNKGEKTCRINAILKNVITDKVVDSKSIQGEGERFFLYAPDQLTPWIRTKFNLDPQEIAADSDSDKNIDEILTNSPEAWKLYTLANQYFLQRKYQESNDVLKKAVEIDKKFALAYRQMSVNYEYLGEVDQAKIYAQKALQLSDRVSLRDSYLVRGWACLLLEDSYEKAIEIYKEMLEYYPDDEDGNTALGAIYRIIEEWDKALERYKIVFKVNPSFSSWNIVRFYSALGLYHKAEEFLLANEQNYSNQTYYHMDLSLIHLYQHKYDLALLEAEKAYSIDPDFYMTTELKGNIFHLQDNFQLAEYYYRQLMGRDHPASQFYGRLWLAHLYLARGQYQKCKKEIVQGIAESEKKGLKTDKLDYLLVLTHLNLQMNQHEEALDASNQAHVIASDIKAKISNIFSLFLYGLSQLEMDRIEEAKNTTEKLKFTITEAGVPKLIRFYHLLKGLIAKTEIKTSQAIQDIENAVSFLSSQYQTFDNHALFFYFLALSYYDSGEMVKAQQQAEKIIDLTTGRLQWGDLYAKSFFWLGKIFQKRGWIEKAVENYEQFLHLWDEADSDIPEIMDAREQLLLLRKKIKE